MTPRVRPSNSYCIRRVLGSATDAVVACSMADQGAESLANKGNDHKDDGEDLRDEFLPVGVYGMMMTPRVRPSNSYCIRRVLGSATDAVVACSMPVCRWLRRVAIPAWSRRLRRRWPIPKPVVCNRNSRDTLHLIGRECYTLFRELMMTPRVRPSNSYCIRRDLRDEFLPVGVYGILADLFDPLHAVDGFGELQYLAIVLMVIPFVGKALGPLICSATSIARIALLVGEMRLWHFGRSF
jgi:hypothetical protein